MTEDYLSPCVGICTFDTEGRYCVGCFRTKQEVAEWYRYSAEKKSAVMEQLPRRRVDLFGDD